MKKKSTGDLWTIRVGYFDADGFQVSSVMGNGCEYYTFQVISERYALPNGEELYNE